MKVRIEDEFSLFPISRQRKYQMRRAREGRCTECGAPVIEGKRCLRHLIDARERQRRSQASRRRYYNTISYKLQVRTMPLAALTVLFGWLVVSSGVMVRAQQLPQTVYVWTMGTGSQNIMMAGLAGIANRNTSGEMLLSPNNGSLPNPLFWLNQLRAAYPQVGVQFQSSPTFFINRYRSLLKGYVLYDRALNADSVNMATSIAGITNALVVDPATLSYATAAGLPLIADTRSLTYGQVYTQYGSQFNPDMLFYQDTTKNEPLRDYAIMNHGFMYYANPTTLNPYVAHQNHQGRIYGWGPSEYDLFFQGSQNAQQVVASDWCWSSSSTAKWRVPLTTQRYHAPVDAVTQTGKHYVAFVMSDGDNVQVLTGGWATDSRWFGSPYRGNFNMTWDLTSTLAEVNPVAFNYYYQHASNGAHKDCFVSASGAGTVFPSQYPDNAGLVASVWQSMTLADQKVISILDPAYDTGTLYPILDAPPVMGMMFKTYDSYYKGRNGALDWHNGKPILSVKYSLWDGGDTALSIANALNDSTHLDALNDPASYSIVNVHPWSTLGPAGSGSGNPMSNLNQLVQWLDSAKVQVVTLEELLVHLRNNFGAPLFFRFDTSAAGLTVSNGLLSMRLTAPPGRNAIVEASADLQTWTPMQTNAVPAGGLVLSVPLAQNQFFRARLAP